MAAANPSPRRSEEGGAQGGEPPRRGTSHGVALAIAISLTVLPLAGYWAFVFWMGDGDRQPVVAPKPAATAAVEEGQPQLPAAVDASQPSAERTRDDGPVSTDAAMTPKAQWRVRVEVEERFGAEPQTRAPLPGAEVWLWLVVGDEERAITRLRADERGIVEHDLTSAVEALRPASRSFASIGARASAPLHVSHALYQELPSEGVAALVRFQLPRGACVRGRIVDAAGVPVAGASVGRNSVEHRVAEVTTTTEEGRFELQIRRAETWTLFASAEGVGGVVTEPFAVDLGIDVERGDLALPSRGFVGGAVVNGRGDPAEGVLVEAFEEGAAASRDPSEKPLLAKEGGLLRGRARSKRDGSFTIGGLAGGSYRLATPEEPSREEGGAQLHELGDRSARLVVTRHRLRVVVVDEEDEPVAGAELHFRYGGDSRTGSADSAGTALFHGRAGQRVVVSASAPGCSPAEGEHTFAAEHDDSELRLTLRPESEARGAIVLFVEDGAGGALRPVTVTLHTALGTLVGKWYRRRLAESGRIEPLAAGRYRLETVAGAPLAAPFAESTLWLSDIRDVEVLDGAPTAVTVRLIQGGRLRFTLRAPPGASTERLAQATLDHVPPLAAPPGLAVAYRLFDDGRVQYGAADFTPDVAFLSAPLLEPGVHRLRFTAPGFLPIEQSFTIRAGQITDVDLLLEPE